MKPRFVPGRLAAASLLVVLAGCATTHPAILDSQALMLTGRHEESVARLEAGVREAPNNRELRAAYFHQRDRVLAQLVAQAETERLAGRLEQAAAIYLRAQKLDPNHPRVRDGLIVVENEQRVASRMAEARRLIESEDSAGAERVLREVLAQAPSNTQARRLLARLRADAPPAPVAPEALSAALSKPITLDFREIPIRQVFDLIARIAGVNFVFDRDTRTDTLITIFVRDASIDEVLRIILTTNQLERKLLNDNTLLIHPDTPAEARQYQELVTRSFYLANADVKQAHAMIRTLVKSTYIFVDERLNLLILKDTPDAVKLAERLIESLDIADPEVMLEVEVLEITRSRLLELGLRFPDQIRYGRLRNDPTSTSSLVQGFIDLRNLSGMTSFIANPALTLNLRSDAGEGNILANPRIRVKNREKARIHIGDRLPVFTTTATPNVGVAASVAYLDVGLKLDVEPNISLDDTVSIKVNLEVSSVSREVTGPAGALAYQIGTRSASTALRLRDGETQVLAGLISNEERSSANRLPGLGDIPVLGRLFSSQRDSDSRTEIVLLITPRILRNIPQPDNQVVPAGSAADVGAAPLLLPRTAPRELSIKSRAGAEGPAAGARQPTPRTAPADRPTAAAPDQGDETPPAEDAAAAAAADQAAEATAPGNAGAPRLPPSSVILTPVAPLPGGTAPTAPAAPAH